MDLDTLKRELIEKQTESRIAKEEVLKERETYIDCIDYLECAEQSRVMLQQVSKSVQQMVHTRIASVVSKCLQTVFDDPYEFQIKFSTARGRTEAKLVFVRDGIEVDPMSASGGGVVDVASFALRLACLTLSRPPLRKLLVLDEPFKFVSKEYRRKIRGLLESLAEEMDFQILFVTHIDDLLSGEVVSIG